MSEQRPTITAVPTKVPAVLRFHKKGPFKAGDRFEVSASAGQLFKAQRFGRIDNAALFLLYSVKVNGVEWFPPRDGEPAAIHMPSLEHPDPLSPSWATVMHPEKIVFVVEADEDVHEFSCEVEGLTVRSAGDAKTHDYDKAPLDVTVEPVIP